MGPLLDTLRFGSDQSLLTRETLLRSESDIYLKTPFVADLSVQV